MYRDSINSIPDKLQVLVKEKPLKKQNSDSKDEQYLENGRILYNQYYSFFPNLSKTQVEEISILYQKYFLSRRQMLEIFGCSMKQYCIFAGQLVRGNISVFIMVNDDSISSEFHTAMIYLQRKHMLQYSWEKQAKNENTRKIITNTWTGVINQKQVDIVSNVKLTDISNIETIIKKSIDMDYAKKGCSVSEFNNEVNRMRKVCVDIADSIPQTTFSLIVKDILNIHNLGGGWYGPKAYRTLDAYFEDFFFQNQIINLDSIKQEYVEDKTLQRYLKNRIRNLDILKLSNTTFATWRFFNNKGYDKEHLIFWLQKVAMIINQNDFISVKYLFINKLISPFFSTLDLDDIFYETLLRTIPECKYFSICSTAIFFSQAKHSKKDFLDVFFKQYCPIDIFLAIDIFKRDYGIEINKASLIKQISNLSLYYDMDMERVYASYKDFLKEII